MVSQPVLLSLAPGLLSAILGVGFWVGGFVVAYYIYRRYADDATGADE